MTRILPCPACGGCAFISKNEYLLPYIQYDNIECLVNGPVADDKNEAIAAWNAMPRALVWSKDPPSTPGWYWFKNVSEPTIIHVKSVPMKREPHPADEWAGPISFPQDEARA